MYGVLRMAGCGLPPQERQAWWGHLCGLCTGLRRQFGQPARLATNSDAALVIALCEAQVEKPIPQSNSFCLLHRPFSRQVDDPSHPAVRYATGAAMLSTANKLRDNLQDDADWLRGARRSVSWLARHWRGAAEEYLGALGFSAGLVESQFSRQTEVEAEAGGDFSDYSQPTELAVGAVFAHTALLQGQAQNYEPLFALGCGYGRIMLLLDAYQDYAQDAQRGHFNPLAAAYPSQDWRQEAQALFHQAYRQLREAVSALELPNPALLHSLLMRQLGTTGHRSLGLCHAASASGPGNKQGKGNKWISNLDGDWYVCGQLCYCCDPCNDCCSSCDRCECNDGCDCHEGSTCPNCVNACISCDCHDACNCCDCGNCDCGNCGDGCNCCDCN